jgi:hypothetical protein
LAPKVGGAVALLNHLIEQGSGAPVQFHEQQAIGPGQVASDCQVGDAAAGLGQLGSKLFSAAVRFELLDAQPAL